MYFPAFDMKTDFLISTTILYFTNYEFEFIEIVVVSAAFNVFFVTKAILKKETKKEEYYQYKKAE